MDCTPNTFGCLGGDSLKALIMTGSYANAITENYPDYLNFTGCNHTLAPTKTNEGTY